MSAVYFFFVFFIYLCNVFLPATHFLISGPRFMLSGQAQVYLGECSVIRGAGRHRNSQPPLMLLPSLHQLIPRNKIKATCKKKFDKMRSSQNLFCLSSLTLTCVFTSWLLQVMVDHDVLRLHQVRRQLSNVLSCQAVGTVNSTTAGIRPKHFLLCKKKKEKKKTNN